MKAKEKMTREEYKKFKGWELWGSMQEQNYGDYICGEMKHETLQTTKKKAKK